MLRDQMGRLSYNNAEFPQLPSKQTILFILNFLEQCLSSFSGDYLSSKGKSHLEDEISQELLFFLNSKAKSTDLLIHFNAQKGVDFLIKVQPFKVNASPLFVIEAKRLSRKHYDYVKGYSDTGGIDRFKREQLGFDQCLAVSAMVAYVQDNTFTHWFTRVNEWITGLIEQSDQNDEILWKSQDLLQEFPSDIAQLARYISTHSRKTQMDIELHHFWLNMQLQ